MNKCFKITLELNSVVLNNGYLVVWYRSFFLFFLFSCKFFNLTILLTPPPTPSHLGIFILGAKRTAFGSFGGAFRNTTATQLQVVAAKAALESAGVRPDQVDSVNIGQVLPVS